MRPTSTASTFLLAISLAMILCGTGRGAEPTGVPAEARDRFNQARDLQKKGHLKEAIKGYDQAIDAGMQAYPRAHIYRADAFRDLKEYETAIAQYTKFLEEFSLEDSCRY